MINRLVVSNFGEDDQGSCWPEAVLDQDLS